jgi:reverse gyrase
MDFEALKGKIKSVIARRMKRDHLDMAHKKPEEPEIVVGHFQRTAEAILFTQIEMYMDARNDVEREALKAQMFERYLHTQERAHAYDLDTELKYRGQLDKAVAVVHQYLMSINGADIPKDVSYTTVHRKKVMGAELLDYFMADITVQAYQLAFAQLGIEPPPPPKTPSRRRAG